MKEYTPPSSKSICHRAMICAAYNKKESIIKNANICDDTMATINALKALGASIKIDKSNKIIKVCSANFPCKARQNIYAKDSASTLRLMIPQILKLNEFCSFTGSEFLKKRPLDAYFEFFDKHKIEYKIENSDNQKHLPISIKGILEAGNYDISVEKSSQFASGLMLYLASKNANSNIKLIGKIESLDYIKLTADLIKQFGINVEVDDNNIAIASGLYKNKEIIVEADYSQSSYFMGLGLLHKGIIIKNLNKNSLQADRRIIHFIKKMSGRLEFIENNLKIYPSLLTGCEVDVSECPDLAPTLAALLSVAKGKSLIKGCRRLKYKESDRLKNTVNELNKLSAKITIEDDIMMIEGVDYLKGNKVSSHRDHRLAMMLSMVKPVTRGKISIDNTECVSKSYPNFYYDYEEYFNE